MEELEFYNNFVKIDKPAPLFTLPAYNPLKDDETKVSLEDMK